MNNSTIDLVYNATVAPQSLLTVVSTGLLICVVNLGVVLGNGLVVVSVLIQTTLRNSHNYVILSLAITDLLLGVLVLPFEAAYIVTGTWNFGAVYCVAHFVFDVLLSTSSILHLCVIAAERFIAIRHPLHYKTLSFKIATCGICLAWTLSFALGLLVLVSPGSWHHPYWESVGLYNIEGTCYVPVNFYFAFISGIFAFYVPEIYLAVTYVWLGLIVKRQFQTVSASIRHSGEGGGREATDQLYKGKLALEASLTKTMTVIVLVFVLLWLPFSILNPLTALYPQMSPTWMTFAAWFGYANSFVNPIIYSILNNQLRRAFIDTITCRLVF